RSPHNRELLQAAAKVQDADVAEGAQDRLGFDLPPPEAGPPAAAQSAQSPAQPAETKLLPAAVQAARVVNPPPQLAPPPLQAPAAPPGNGTVVLDVEGGVVVPSLIGKPLREAIETAQEAGIELEVIGSGVARAQAPPPGTRIPAGARVAVRFAR